MGTTQQIALGVDIGGTRLKAARVDSSGRVHASGEIPTPRSIDPFRAALAELIRNTAAGEEIQGAGIACKGIIDPATTRIVRQPGVLSFIEGLTLRDLVRETLDVPVFADNDARVTLIGECVWGAARGLRDALLFTLGTGVGGAILSDGRILRGYSGIAGHLGHMTVEVDGPPCICGNRGCLEAVFSARVVEADAWSAIHRGLPFANPHTPPTCAEVFAAAEAGNATALWIVEKGVRKLGAAIAGLAHSLDPEAVIVGGQVAAAGDFLFEPLRREVWERTRQLLGREIPIVPTQVADPSGVIGAAALVFEADSAAGFRSEDPHPHRREPARS